MSGARMVGHALFEGKRRGVKYGVVIMSVDGGIGTAGCPTVILVLFFLIVAVAIVEAPPSHP